MPDSRRQDVPGEFFWDSNASILYVIPPAGQPAPAKSTLVAGKLDALPSPIFDARSNSTQPQEEGGIIDPRIPGPPVPTPL